MAVLCRRLPCVLIATATAFLALAGSAGAAFPGDPDYRLNWKCGGSRAMDVDGSGRIAVVRTEGAQTLTVARCLSERGEADPTFDGDGLASRDVLGVGITLTATAIAARAGDALVVGADVSSGAASHWVLEGFDADGSTDEGFGDEGSVTETGFGNDARLVPGGLLPLPEDGLLAVGLGAAGSEVHLARHTASGAHDPGFGTGGRKTVALSAGDAPLRLSVARTVRDAGGRIVIAGLGEAGAEPVVAVARFTPDGDLDGTFGDGGVFTMASSGAVDRLGVDVQPDGRVVVATGAVDTESGYEDNQWLVLRLTEAGALDPQFGEGGKVPMEPGHTDHASEEAHAVLVDAEGRIVVAGTAWYYEHIPGPGEDVEGPATTLRRLTPNGEEDPFGEGGYPDEAPEIHTLRLDPVGRILVGDTDDVSRYFAEMTDVEAPYIAVTTTRTWFKRSTVTMAFTVDEPAAAECRLDQGAWEPCSSSKAYPGLADGAYLFAVRATDSVGNQSTPREWPFGVDTVVPETEITGAPTGTVEADDADEVVFTFEDVTAQVSPTRFKCRWDTDDGWSDCGSPRDAGAPLGHHRFQVKGVDDAGNAETTPAERWVTVVSARPKTTITRGPAAVIETREAAFEFAADDPHATFECRFDGGAWESCASGRGYTGLTNGDHLFEVRATDRKGNREDPPVSWAFRVQPPGDGGGSPTPPPDTGQRPPDLGPPADVLAPEVGLGVLPRSLRASRRGVVRFRFGRAQEDLTGTLRLALRNGRPAGRAPARAGEDEPIASRVRLARRARKALRRAGRLRVRGALTMRDAAGNATTRVFSITLKAARRR